MPKTDILRNSHEGVSFKSIVEYGKESIIQMLKV